MEIFSKARNTINNGFKLLKEKWSKMEDAKKGWVIMFVLFSIMFSQCEPPKDTRTPEQKRIESQFSGWDGSHIEHTKIIKMYLKDPSSYEHISTKYKYLKESDEVYVNTKYRAKNSFGGYVVGELDGTYKIKDNQ